MSKVTNRQCVRAIENLEKAGYQRKDIGVYVLMGLPGQDEQEVRDSVRFIHDQGAAVKLASFSPIPGTRETDRAVEMGVWNPDSDLLLTNNTLFPVWKHTIGYESSRMLVEWVKELNSIL